MDQLSGTERDDQQTWMGWTTRGRVGRDKQRMGDNETEHGHGVDSPSLENDVVASQDGGLIPPKSR